MSKSSSSSAANAAALAANEKAKAGLELIRVIDQLTREKGIPAEVSFNAIERAVRLAIGKHFGDEDDVSCTIDRKSGIITAQKGEQGDRPVSLALSAASPPRQPSSR